MTVFQRRCQACGTQAHYEGKDAGVFNFSNHTLLTEEVPRDYWNDFWNHKQLGMYTYWQSLQRKYDFALGGTNKFLCKQTFS